MDRDGRVADDVGSVILASRADRADGPQPATGEAMRDASGDGTAAGTGAVATADGRNDFAKKTDGATTMISALVLVSRITGFMRTWAQALAIGVTPLASCYTVANNLPSQLYELVVGGMLVTAFLPVYMSLKGERGEAEARRYATNLTSIVTIGMAVVTVASLIFASQIVWTQSFGATTEFDSGMATWFFRFFAIEMLLYSLSSIFSGILNAERDYLWSSVAPIANNVVTIGSFFAYMALVGSHPSLALLVLALGNPLGVLAQVLIQLPSARRSGVALTPHIDLHDPALRDTLSIGIPSLVVMVCSFVTVSVQTSSCLSVTAAGASIAAYARLWYTLPYAIFVVPITTTMFTELSDRFAAHDERGWRDGVSYGTGRILFVSIPLAMLLCAFSYRLVSMIGPDFTDAETTMTAQYLMALAAALPFYGVGMYLQKVCSSVRAMGTYAATNIIAAIVQILVCVLLTPRYGIMVVAYSTLAYFVAVDVATLVRLRSTHGRIGMRATISAACRGLACGMAGMLVAVVVLTVAFGGVASVQHSTLRSAVQCLVAGIPAIAAVAAVAVAARFEEVSGIADAVGRRLGRTGSGR